MKPKYFNGLLLVLFILIIHSCKTKNNSWNVNLEGIISSSSPQCIDLNNDGTLDIIMGAGSDEWEKTESGVLAIDGRTGVIIWKAKARNQIVGSAIFLLINNDKIPDIIIGGRSAELQALNGKTGNLIWEFYKKPGKLSAHDDGWHNFFNPQLVLDQNNDGVKDILICNGGDALLAAGSKNRPVGKLLLLSGKTGQVLAIDQMPDGSETYSTPVCFDCETNINPTFLFGSGGETHSGHLYISDLNSLKNKELNTAKVISTSINKGFIAPPILAHFNNDKKLDIIVNQVDGTTKIIDGASYKTKWEVHCDASEVYSQPAIGYFIGNDKILDVFVSYAKGIYPIYIKSVNYLIDGKTGTIFSKKEITGFTYSSPLVADVDNDGVDEVLLNTIHDYKERGQKKPYYEITIYNFANNTEETFSKKQYGACFSSTPWLGNLDGNDKLDLIFTGSPAAISEFPGTTTYIKPPKVLQIQRMEFEKYSPKSVKWGNYLGKNSQSIYY